ncbi:glycosyl hydrolase family 8 [Clostridium weizhouense]|uniref:Glycosyl hydrolase family 8 n=1 Tax=Clostridium weizhouense TaxID=2859781 RepID=A0ABS7AKU7_9CLOT|nr:glycosyl hydrolase family 8 [Clostridium weizhouense]MBW6409031.1 glycosyl hydrolase family 8 [Clostridium weizhouense]
MKKKVILIGATLLLLSTIIYYIAAPYFRTVYSDKIWLGTNISKEEEVLFDFVNNNLTDSNGGIYTNYTNVKSAGDITKGHAILSESQGIMLLYSLEKNDKILFDKTLEYIKNNMILSNSLISWRVEGSLKSDTSATIDDLRIVKALLLAEKRWNIKSYRVMAINISRGIYKELVDNNVIVDFNDRYKMSDVTTLCYLDLETLRMLSDLDSSWKKVLESSVQIINNGYISDEVPFYKKEFNRKQETYDDNQNIDTLLSMIVILNKQENGQDISKSIQWIKNRFKADGFISTSYSKDGKAISNIESTSIYSFIVQISSRTNDEELAKLAMNKIRAFQISNFNSPVYGGYGMDDGSQVYSYDNLNALMSYRYFKY